MIARPLAEQLGGAFDLGGEAVGAFWLGERALFATGEGEIVAFDQSGVAVWRVRAHEGGLLGAAALKSGLVTGGDDGRVALTNSEGETRLLAFLPGAWSEAVAASPASGAIVVGAGKEAVLIGARDGIIHRFGHDATIAGLAFEPNGRRFAAAHYGGATISWASNPEGRRKTLDWKGSHLGIAWSPNARFLVTIMQENALHGWRLQDGSHFRMAGYPSKIRSLSFSPDGAWLATAGAPEAILWPFAGATGPAGREATLIGQLDAPASAVAFHPSLPILAAGSARGELALFPLGAGARPVLIDPPGAGRIVALAWSADGMRLAYSAQSGRTVIADFSALMPGARTDAAWA